MAKIDLTFIDVDCDSVSMKVYANACNELEIVIKHKKNLHDGIEKDKQSTIVLDIPTAIKFHKTLRTEINKAKEEVGNE